MTSTYIAYDLRSGQIISVHCGHVDVPQVHQRLRRYAKIETENISVIEVPYEAFEQGKQYKVDLSRKALVETRPGERGVGFSFGKTGQIHPGL